MDAFLPLLAIIGTLQAITPMDGIADRQRFPPQEQMLLMIDLNERFQAYCQQRADFAFKDEDVRFWRETLCEAQTCHQQMGLLTIMPHEVGGDVGTSRYWQRYLSYFRNSAGDDAYFNAEVIAVPYWRFRVID